MGFNSDLTMKRILYTAIITVTTALVVFSLTKGCNSSPELVKQQDNDSTPILIKPTIVWHQVDSTVYRIKLKDSLRLTIKDSNIYNYIVICDSVLEEFYTENRYKDSAAINDCKAVVNSVVKFNQLQTQTIQLFNERPLFKPYWSVGGGVSWSDRFGVVVRGQYNLKKVSIFGGANTCGVVDAGIMFNLK